MLTPTPHAGRPQRSPKLPPSLIEKRRAAKWPPDDADLANMPAGPAPGGGGGGGFDPGGDGNFKKGATKPIIIILGLLVVIGAVVLGVLAAKNEGEKMTVDQIAVERKNIEMLPKAEQTPKWREWAKRDDVPALQQDAFANLAWAKDDQGLATIIDKGLGSNDHRIRAQASTALWEYKDKAASALPKLQALLKEADSTDKPQICWALAVLKDGSSFDAVLAEYREGHLASIQSLNGSPAFDPEVMSGMVTIDKLQTYAGDSSPSVRQLTATVLSREADPKYTDVLIKLVVDKDVEVAREAAVGLGKIANEKAVAPLLTALENADKESRQKFLEALRDGVGSNGLILALKSVQKGHEAFQMKQLFDMMRELEDPRAGDMLVDFIEKSNPHPHWKTEAALRLAEIGDVRAVPYLAWRLMQDPMKLYSDKEEELYARQRMDDNERVISARMLADLAILNPDKKDLIRSQAEDAVIAWATEHPQPHANAMRFLAVVGSPKGLPKLRKWADPTDALPKEGQQPPMPDSYATAQSALRYIGWAQDPQSWDVLVKQITRRPPKVDVTMDSMLQGGLAILGMTLRGLGVGASDGFAQWGDPKAFPLLMKYIEEPMENEQSRYEACFALSWVATDDNMKEVVTKVHTYNKPDPKSQLIRGCLLESLVHRPIPSATAGLLDLLTPTGDVQVRHQAARAMGFGGMDATVKGKLMEMMKDEQLRSDAMVAILIGADPDTVGQALARYNGTGPEAMEDLKSTYDRSFGYWSDKNYENGDVARWIINAEACRYVKVNEALQDWPRMILQRAIQGIEFDNGPHSITRVQFRVRLIRDAKGGDPKKREEAIAILKFMKEKGVLMALRNEPAPLGDLAKQAFFEVMNPKISDQKIPENEKASGNGGNAMPHP